MDPRCVRGVGVALGLFTASARGADPPPEAPPVEAPEAARSPSPPALAPRLLPVAEPWWRSPPAPPPPTRADPLMGMGIAITSVGAAGLIASSVILATAKKLPPAMCDPCTSSACPFPPGGTLECRSTPQTPQQRINGSALFGASLVTVMIGIPVAAIGSIEVLPEQGSRESDSMMLVGVGLATAGAAAVAAGAFAGLAKRKSAGFDGAAIASLVGTGGMLVGIPVWAGATKRRLSPSEDGFRLVRRSRKLMVGGITLTLLGATLIGGGAVVESLGGFDLDGRVFGGVLGLGGVGMALAGIPMWYIGQDQVPVREEGVASLPGAREYAVSASSGERRERAEEPRRPPVGRASLYPEVQVGPTSMALRWLF
jgi:hypothetical protein